MTLQCAIGPEPPGSQLSSKLLARTRTLRMSELRRVSFFVCLTALGLLVLAIVPFATYHAPIPGVTAPPIYGAESIQMPFGKLALVRNGDHLAAIKILRSVSRGAGYRNGAEYEYWYQGDGSHDLTKPNVEHGTGIVFAKYAATQVGPPRYSLAGSQLNIEAGPLWVEWSQSNYVYARPRYGRTPPPIPVVEITGTEWADVSEVDLAAPGLRWITVKHVSPKDAD